MPGREVQPAAVEADHQRVLVDHQRPRADEAHLAAQDVEELGELVERGAAQERADARDARVVRDLEQPAPASLSARRRSFCASASITIERYLKMRK